MFLTFPETEGNLSVVSSDFFNNILLGLFVDLYNVTSQVDHSAEIQLQKVLLFVCMADSAVKI